MPDSVITQLHRALDLERQALISADFARLGGLLQQKQDLLEQLQKSPPGQAELRPIRQKMDQNQTLLSAAIKGVAAAGDRLQALYNVQNNLSVYDHSGRVELIQKHTHHLEKKA